MKIKNIKELKGPLKKYISIKDTLYIESDLTNLLKNTDIIFKKKSLNEILNLFKSLIGPKGTIICPSFTYSWGRDKKKKYFDVKRTKALTGSFAEFLRTKKNSFRTPDPMFSFVVHGLNKKNFFELDNDSFGKRSVFSELLKSNAKLISFCLNQFDPTFVHFVEQFYHENIKKIDYRSKVSLMGKLKNYQSKIYSKKQVCLLRNVNSKLFFDEKNIKKTLLKKKMLKVIKLKFTKIYIVNAKDFFQEGLMGMIKNPHFFVSKK
tara:strand:- start:458 stop:1246 length:789 start_codon:yes stop_codon:yes gene_type:complete